MIILNPDSFIMDNQFFIKPFHKLSNILVEKQTPENIFDVILKKLFEYFSDIKEHRTIYDVDEIIKQLDDFVKSSDLIDVEKGEIDEESKDVKEMMDDFTKKHSEEIEKIFSQYEISDLLSAWILQINAVLNVLSESLGFFEKKTKRLIRSSRMAKNLLDSKLLDLLKAIFLVLFRIVEQIYMIATQIPFDSEKEIDYLIEDVVYLENIQRTVIDALK